MSESQDELAAIPLADLKFLRVFLPYELRLAQRRAMVSRSRSDDERASSSLGLYLIHLVPLEGDWFPASLEGGSQIGDHICAMLTEVLRDSDIPVRLSDQEQLGILRDLDPQHAYVVAQRFLTMAANSHILQAANLATRVGYVIYPLSTQPNYPPAQWATVLELARLMSDRGDSSERASGHGLLMGPGMAETGLSETDLIPLAVRDPDSMVKAGLLQIQRIHLLPSP